MTRYEFHCDGNVLELARDEARVFIDLNDIEPTRFECEESPDLNTIPVYVDPADVRDLFGSYGCLEKCPFGESDDDLVDRGLVDSDGHPSDHSFSPNPGGYCIYCGYGRDHS